MAYIRNDDTGEWYYQRDPDDPAAGVQDPHTYGLAPGTTATNATGTQYMTPGGSTITTDNSGNVLQYIAPGPSSTNGYAIQTGPYGNKFISVDVGQTVPGEAAYSRGAQNNIYLVNDDGSVGPLWDPNPSIIGGKHGVELNLPTPEEGGIGGFISNNGWVLPLALATFGVGAGLAGGGALAAEGIGAAGAAEGIGGAAALDSTAAALGGAGGGGAFVPAAGSGASFALPGAAATGIAGGTGLTGGAGGSTGLLSGGTTSGLTIPGGAGIAVDPAIAAGSGAGIGGTGAAVGGGLSSFGGLSPALPAAGSVGGAGAGLSAELAPGTILGTGLPGAGEIGVSYAAGANGLPATDFFGNYIPASSVNFGGVPNTVTGTNLSDALRTGNQIRQGASAANNLSKLLSQGVGSGLSSSLGQLAKGVNPAGTALTNVVHSNQNPFAQEQYFQVSNPKPDLSALANLLKQG